jgi:nucleotide-binding universal stress UspA family protein
MTIQLASKRVSLENILYATDFSRPSIAALPYVLAVARKYGSNVIAAHVISSAAFQISPQTMEMQAITAQAIREADEAMGALDSQLRGIQHEMVVRKGDIWKELSTIVEKQGIDLIVVGTHGRSAIGKLLMGSVAEQIFRQAPCPVLTVGPDVSGEPDSIVEMHAILYPTDFSPESLAAAPYAISLAQENQAHLYLLHITSSPVGNSTEAALLARLRTLVPPEARLWCEPRAYVESGEPAQKVLDMTEELEADMIVLGTKHIARHASPVTHLAMPVAYKIASHAICPVLTVYSPE